MTKEMGKNTHVKLLTDTTDITKSRKNNNILINKLTLPLLYFFSPGVCPIPRAIKHFYIANNSDSACSKM